MLTTGKILSMDCRANITKDEKIRFARAIEAEVRVEAQPPAPCPKCECRANGTMVAMPSSELKKMQAKVAEQAALIEKCEKALSALVDEARVRNCGLKIADEAIDVIAASKGESK